MKTGGWLLIVGDGPAVEFDTVGCCHCGSIIVVKPATHGQVYLIADDRSPTGWREEPGAYCAKCYGPICLPCDNGTCKPLEQRLDQIESAARRGR